MLGRHASTEASRFELASAQAAQLRRSRYVRTPLTLPAGPERLGETLPTRGSKNVSHASATWPAKGRWRRASGFRESSRGLVERSAGLPGDQFRTDQRAGRVMKAPYVGYSL